MIYYIFFEGINNFFSSFLKSLIYEEMGAHALSLKEQDAPFSQEIHNGSNISRHKATINHISFDLVPVALPMTTATH